jgi:hypothetical protein
MMKLNSIMIASMLLVAVFCYDIFFVFLTPLFMDGQSVMITVAKGGGGDSTADDFCYRYPDDKDCTGIDFLPMLLIIPRINDYMNGSVLLGLGDIVCKCDPLFTHQLSRVHDLICVHFVDSAWISHRLLCSFGRGETDHRETYEN